jgi:hypothetical protein
MEVDPNSLDPDLRTARFLSLASAAFGLMSLCLAIIPACGGIVSLLGIICGVISQRTEKTMTATAGIVISVLGLVITLVYGLFLLFFRNIE